MAVYNIIKRSDIREGLNILAEHYQYERLFTEKVLKSISSFKFSYYFKESTETIQPQYIDKNWNVFDLSDTLTHFLDEKDVSEKENVDSTKKIAKPYWFIISRLRHYLKEMAIVPEMDKKIALSTEYIVFYPKRDIDAYFLLPFCLSKYVQKILDWAQTGNEHPRFSNKTLQNLYIPDILIDNSNHFKELIRKAIFLRKQSHSLYTQATQLLEEALGLDKIEFKREKCYTARASRVLINRRSDSEFFNPTLRKYWNHFESVSGFALQPITQFCSVIKFGNPDYASQGIPIITQKHLSNISPENYGTDPIASLNWVSKYPNAVLRENDLLFYSVGAYLGKTNIWFNKDTAVPASFITLLRPYSEADAGYLMILLNSKYGILQSKVFQSGTSQQYIYPKDIRQFKIPDISLELKQKLYDLLKRSYENINESKQLLEQAKQEVENLIEQAANKNE